MSSKHQQFGLRRRENDRISRLIARPRVERLERRTLFDAGLGFALGFGTSSELEQGWAIATDAAANVYVTGRFKNTVDFDPGAGVTNLTSAGEHDIFVAKYTSAGTLVWAKNMGGTGGSSSSESGLGIGVDAAGNVYTTGNYKDTADFDPGPGTYNLTGTGNFNGFVSKLSPTGDFVWAANLPTTAGNWVLGAALTVDANGVLATGYFSGNVDFNPGGGTFNMSDGGGTDAFILRLNFDGTFAWAKQLTGTGLENGMGIETDAAGNIYMTGYFTDTPDFDPGAGTHFITCVGVQDFYVLKLTSTGTFVWAKGVGGVDYDRGWDLAVDDAGNPHVAGYFKGTVDFDPSGGVTNLSSQGTNEDFFVTKFDTSGNFQWAVSAGGVTENDWARGIDVNSDGEVFVTGYFGGTGDFDPGPGVHNLSSITFQADIFLLKLNGSGGFVWAHGIGSAGDDSGLDIVLDANGNLCTTGYFWGLADFDPGAGTQNLTSAGQEDIFIAGFLDSSNLPPDADPGGPYTGVEGTPFGLDGSGSTDPDQSHLTLTYEWDLNYDGVTFQVDVTGMTPNVTIFDDVVAGTIALRVTDSFGVQDIATTTVTITNAPPTITTFNVPDTGGRNVPVNLSATASDPAGANDPLTFAWTVTGPGGFNQVLNGLSVNFTPPDLGTYNAELVVTDGDGGSATQADTVNVVNANPVIGVFDVPDNGFEGTIVSVSADATDPDGPAGSLTYTWTITGPNGFNQGFVGPSGSFFPPEDGIYTVQLVVADGDGGSTQQTDTVNVANVAPTVTFFNVPDGGVEGASVDLSAAATDPAGPNDTLTFTWTITGPNGFNLVVTGANAVFTPPDNGAFTVDLIVSDEDGGDSTPQTDTVDVANVEPSITAFDVPDTGAEGGPVNLTATATDPAAANDTLTYTWTITGPNGFNQVLNGTNPNFTPPENGIYTATLLVEDDDGGSVQQADSIAVVNLNPTITLFDVPDTGLDTNAVALAATATDAGAGNDPLTYSWTITGPNGFNQNFTSTNPSFIPPDNGIYTVELIVTDDDGGSVQQTDTVNVANGDPTLTLDALPTAIPTLRIPITMTLFDAEADLDAGFTFRFDWDGDSVVDQTVTGLSGTVVEHAFDTPGVFTITVTAEDKDGGISAAVTHQVTLAVNVLVPDPVDPGKTAVVLFGSSSNDKFIVKPALIGGIFLKQNKTIIGTLNPTGHIIAIGGAGNDKFNVSGALQTPVWLFGGAGNDVLKGSRAADMLLGGEGDDKLAGRLGQDQLFGGLGLDILKGGPDSDLLIGGQTTYNQTQFAIAAFESEWNSLHDYPSRANNLAGVAHPTFSDRLNSDFFLQPNVTVLDDGVKDILIGAAKAADLFFQAPLDFLKDAGKDAGEITFA